MSKTLLPKMGAAALVAVLAAPLGAYAESNLATGNGALSANANVDFQITIPKFLSLRVGTVGATIDMVSFNVPAANVGNGTPVAGTGGNVGGGAVSAAVLGNSGNVSLQATTGGAISDGTDTIAWSQITTATSNPSLAAPVLANGASGIVTVNAVSGVVNQSATWTYSYTNSAVVPAGTYGGVNVNNGRVTYTASVP